VQTNGPMKFNLPGLADGATLPDAQVFNSFGCSGGNQSPMIMWNNVPPGTQSLALTMYDPDAPTGSGWWHWVVFNIPSGMAGLPANASGKLPKGAIESVTDYGNPGYGGACPPVGSPPHHYIFTLYALKVKTLPLDAKTPPAMVGFYVNQNTLAKATVTLLYGRNK